MNSQKLFAESEVLLKIAKMHSSRMRSVYCSGRQGVCIPACTGQGGGSGQGVSGQGGCLPGGGCLPRGGGVCLLGCLPHTPLLPVNRMTDVCENITLPQLRCGR